jgi:glycosyltransferase 2 family protein
LFGRYRHLLQKIGLAAGLLLLVYQTIRGGQALWLNGAFTGRLWLLIPALVLLVAAFAVQILAWEVLLQAFNIRIPFRNLWQGYILTFLPRYIPGSVWGYLSRAEWLYQTYQIPHSLSNTISLHEFILAGLSSVLMVAVSGWIQSSSAALTGIVACVVLPGSVYLLLMRLQSLEVLKKRLFHGNPRVNFKRWCLSLAILTLNWLFYAGALCLVAQSLLANRFELSQVLFFRVAGDFSLAWLIGFMMIIFPSGLGVREMVLSFLAASCFGVPLNLGNAIAVASRLLTSLAELSWVAAAFINRRQYAAVLAAPANAPNREARD